MRIGITFDLREDYLSQGFTEEETAEFDRGETIDAIDGVLQALGYDTERIGNIKRLASLLNGGRRWDMVFNIAEGVRGFGREAQVPALLEAYGIPYTFSDPLVLSIALHKAMAKRVIRDLGLPTPDFCLVEEERDLERMDLPFPLFAKPVAEGTGKGIDARSKIRDRAELAAVCRELLATHKQPVLVETFLPGREVTVGVLGTGNASRVLGVLEVVLKGGADPDVYSYRNKENCESLVEYRMVRDNLATAAGDIALKAWKGLGGRDAGRIDLRVDARGVPHFLEVNPLAGLHPEHSDLCIMASMAGMTYRELMEEIMKSARGRMRSAFLDRGEKRWAVV